MALFLSCVSCVFHDKANSKSISTFSHNLLPLHCNTDPKSQTHLHIFMKQLSPNPWNKLKQWDLMCKHLHNAVILIQSKENWVFDVPIRDITYKATEFVLLMYHSVYGVFSSAMKIYFAHRVLYNRLSSFLNKN